MMDPAERGRVTVEAGLAAYRITGARPERGAFTRYAHPEGGAALEAACGIGVLVEAGWIRRHAREPYHEAASRELGRPYAEGFAHGFDGRPVPGGRWTSGPDLERMRQGQRDGRALWAAVRDGVPSPVPDFPPAGWAPAVRQT